MTSKKILIVDDDEAIRRSMQDALVAEEFEVITANDGVVGLTRALNERPDLILTDLKMPELGGMGMMEELRKTGEWGKTVPVIILTNFDTDEKDMQNIIKNEPSFYFLKSKINPNVIVETIKEKLGAGVSKESQ